MEAKGKLMRLASLSVMLVALLAIFGCGGGAAGGGGGGGGGGGEGGGDLLQEVKDRGVLRVSTDPVYPPHSFQTESGEFKRLGVGVE